MKQYKYIKFFINSLSTEQDVFRLKYSLDTYNWLVELQNNENWAIKWWWKSYVPLSIEKNEKSKNVLVYLTLK